MGIFTVFKILVSATIIALASELSKKSTFAAAITLALPLTSLLALVWVQFESDDKEQLISLSWNIFWLVPPSLAFFPTFATLISRNVPFWLSFVASAALTVVIYIAYSRILGVLGIKL
jgi:hypothetical protein